VKYVRGNFWPGLFFDDLVDLNRQGRGWLDNVANIRVHGTTGDVPFVRLTQEALQPLAGRPDYDTSLVCYRRSTKDCLVSYEGNHYSVPASHARQRLLLKETEQGELGIYALDGLELARHSVLQGHMATEHHRRPLPDLARQRAGPATSWGGARGGSRGAGTPAGCPAR
jgi:hypothetical protein